MREAHTGEPDEEPLHLEVEEQVCGRDVELEADREMVRVAVEAQGGGEESGHDGVHGLTGALVRPPERHAIRDASNAEGVNE